MNDCQVMIEKKKVADYVIEHFMDKLRNGILKEGDKLPNQNEYAQRLGVSRLSLREALQTLQAMGAVSQRPKTGTVITCADPAKWVRTIPSDILKDAQSVNELLDARMLIESAVVSQCTGAISQADLDALEILVRKQRQALEDQNLTEFWECDTKFHLQLVLATKNRYLFRMYMEIFQQTKEFITETFKEIPQTIIDAICLHEKIYAAMVMRDSKEAAALTAQHIRLVKQHCEAYFQRKK